MKTAKIKKESRTNLEAGIQHQYHGVSIFRFMEVKIKNLKASHRLGTAKNYRSAMASLQEFTGGRDLSFRKLSAGFMAQYSDYLRSKGLVKNSISFHMRILRAVYNQASREGLVEAGINPFSNVYTGVDNTRKRAIDKGIIRRIKDLDLSQSKALLLTRDLFLFSLYTRGMSFVDIAFLKRENISDGEIYYTRRKTKKPLTIRIEPCIQQIIDRYNGWGEEYLFPIVKSENEREAYLQYRISMAYHNRLLKRISKMLGLERGLTFYVARHSWATLARDSDVPISVISAGMGHSSERTTQIYLRQLENRLIDNANHGILEQLGK